MKKEKKSNFKSAEATLDDVLLFAHAEEDEKVKSNLTFQELCFCKHISEVDNYLVSHKATEERTEYFLMGQSRFKKFYSRKKQGYVQSREKELVPYLKEQIYTPNSMTFNKESLTRSIELQEFPLTMRVYGDQNLFSLQHFLNLNGYSIVNFKEELENPNEIFDLANFNFINSPFPEFEEAKHPMELPKYVNVEFTGKFVNEDDLRKSLLIKGIQGKAKINTEIQDAKKDDDETLKSLSDRKSRLEC